LLGSSGTVAALACFATPAYQAGPLVRPTLGLPLSMIRRPGGHSSPRLLPPFAVCLADRFPGRNFGGNQPLARSSGLSPLCAAPTSDLRLSTAPDLQRYFQRLPPGHAKIARYRVAPAELRPPPVCRWRLSWGLAIAPPVRLLAADSPGRGTPRSVLQDGRCPSPHCLIG
jgi:hypothetical protein